MKPQHKKLSALLALSLWAARPLSAQILPPGMEDLATSILDIFTGPFVRIILAIFLCGSAIAYGFNKDNEKIKRNCIAVGVSAAIIIAASAIVDAVWTASGG
ncbi:MAG: TrbC/VirB2 family protein [Treponema sp.]|jgi:type IV secretory pathway VirB2 component (pilin)|nr:TrbC/VirB2 family protein [Treponema sp.]